MQVTAFSPAEPLVRSSIEGYPLYEARQADVIKTVPGWRMPMQTTLTSRLQDTHFVRFDWVAGFV